MNLAPGQKKVHDILTMPVVEGFISGLLMFNMALVWVETDIMVHEPDPPVWIQLCNYLLLIIYSVEIGARLYVYRLNFFSFFWNVMDFVIVSLDIFGALLTLANVDVPSLSVLRIFRLCRLARGVKILMLFPQLALLVKGIAATVSVIFWGLILLLAMLIIFSIIAVQLIHPINKDLAYGDCDRCNRAFESVLQASLTFVQQIVAGDSWGTVSIPIIEESPVTAVFFVFVLVTLNLAILNVMLAVIVDASLKASQEDAAIMVKNKEKEFQGASKTLLKICERMDLDNSGQITLRELQKGFHGNKEFQDILALMDVKEDDLEAVFGILDKDGSGDVAYNEFIEELHRMKSHDSHTMLIFIKYYVTEIRTKLTDQVSVLENRILRKLEATRPSGLDPLSVPQAADHALPPNPSDVSVFSRELLQVQEALSQDLAQATHGIQKALEKQTAQLAALGELREQMPTVPDHTPGLSATAWQADTDGGGRGPGTPGRLGCCAPTRAGAVAGAQVIPAAFSADSATALRRGAASSRPLSGPGASSRSKAELPPNGVG